MTDVQQHNTSSILFPLKLQRDSISSVTTTESETGDDGGEHSPIDCTINGAMAAVASSSDHHMYRWNCSMCNYETHDADLFRGHLSEHEKLMKLNSARPRSQPTCDMGDSLELGFDPNSFFDGDNVNGKGHCTPDSRAESETAPCSPDGKFNGNGSRRGYQCDICGMHFSQKANMQRHRVRHTGIKPYQCKVCFKRFFRKDHMQEHMVVHIKVNERFECPLCSDGFSTHTSLKTHINAQHGSEQGPKRCKICHTIFGTAKRLIVHYQTKHVFDPSILDECGGDELTESDENINDDFLDMAAEMGDGGSTASTTATLPVEPKLEFEPRSIVKTESKRGRGFGLNRRLVRMSSSTSSCSGSRKRKATAATSLDASQHCNSITMAIDEAISNALNGDSGGASGDRCTAMSGLTGLAAGSSVSIPLPVSNPLSCGINFGASGLSVSATGMPLNGSSYENNLLNVPSDMNTYAQQLLYANALSTIMMGGSGGNCGMPSSSNTSVGSSETVDPIDVVTPSFDQVFALPTPSFTEAAAALSVSVQSPIPESHLTSPLAGVGRNFLPSILCHDVTPMPPALKREAVVSSYSSNAISNSNTGICSSTCAASNISGPVSTFSSTVLPLPTTVVSNYISDNLNRQTTDISTSLVLPLVSKQLPPDVYCTTSSTQVTTTTNTMSPLDAIVKIGSYFGHNYDGGSDLTGTSKIMTQSTFQASPEHDPDASESPGSEDDRFCAIRPVGHGGTAPGAGGSGGGLSRMHGGGTVSLDHFSLLRQQLFPLGNSAAAAAAASAALWDLASARSGQSECVHCGIVFIDQTLYFLHKGLHSESDPWRCNLCGAACGNKYSFHSHLISAGHV